VVVNTEKQVVVDHVAEQAAEVYRSIRHYRKEYPPHMNSGMRKELAEKEIVLKEQWWEKNKHFFLDQTQEVCCDYGCC
jgi:hypothetical protein